jgi:hypothetical protein
VLSLCIQLLVAAAAVVAWRPLAAGWRNCPSLLPHY